MGERALENRIRKIKELERQQEELAGQIDKIKAEIKAYMQEKGAEEVHAGNFIVRLKEVITSRFDSKSFKAQYNALYEAYTKPQSTMRLTIV